MMKVTIDEDCVKNYNDLKFRKINAQYIIYELVKEPNSEHIKVAEVGDKGKTWNEFLARFPPNEPRYAIFDAEFVNPDGMSISKLIFVYWLPDTVSLKSRVTYAASKEALRSQTGGLKEISVCSINDKTFEEVIKEFK